MPRLRRRNLVGHTFGRLTVVEPAADTADGLPQWSCACSCGATSIATSRALHAGDTRSCGCLRREHIARVSPWGRARMGIESHAQKAVGE